MMRRWLLPVALCSLAACSGSTPPAAIPADSGVADVNNVDTGAPDVTSTDTGAPDARSDVTPADAGRRVACLDQPDELPRPPADILPCELIPPGL